MFHFQWFAQKVSFLAYWGGWWDIALFMALSVVAELPFVDDFPAPITDLLPFLFLLFLIRAIYALHEYFPYGRKGRTVWYPLSEAVGLFILVMFLEPVFTMIPYPYSDTLFILPAVRITNSLALVLNNLLGVVFSKKQVEDDLGYKVGSPIKPTSPQRSSKSNEGHKPSALQTYSENSIEEFPEIEEMEAELVDEPDINVADFNYREKQITQKDRPRLPTISIFPWNKNK